MVKLNKNLVKSSLILLITLNLYNFLNFFFHFSMARMLSVSNYGILATLFSIMYIFGIFAESVQIIITKYTSHQSNKGKLKNLIKKSFKKALIFSSVLFLVYLIVSIPLSSSLEIPFLLLAINGLFIFSSFFPPITRGVLQGLKRFSSLGGNMVFEGVSKLILAIIFVLLLTKYGLAVHGAVVATILGVFLAFLLSFVSLKDIFNSKEKEAMTHEIYGYSAPVFVTLFVVLIFYSLDIVLAKMFFSQDIAGAYALASILGKSIFLGTNGISKAMFPLSSSVKKTKKRYHHIFFSAFAIMFACIFIALAIIYFFPSLLIKLFSGKEVPLASSLLFYIGLAAGFISFANLILLYKLSLKKTRGCYYLLLFIVVQISLLTYFSKNIFTFTLAFVFASLIFLIGSIFLLDK